MLPKLLLLFLVLVGIGILVFRLSSSGAEISRRAQFFTNPFSDIFKFTIPDGKATTSDGVPFPFPAVPGSDLPDNEILDNYPESSADSFDAKEDASVNDLVRTEEEYDAIKRRVIEAQNFGTPSPYRGLVSIADSYGGVSADDSSLEYIVLASAPDNTAPISLNGWSLQSVRNRTRHYIPAGARQFIMGSVPEVAPVSLKPGERAIVGSGQSPVGTSFLENLCSGYLGQFQTFVPSLDERCPTPESEILSEPVTSRTNDPSCVDFAALIPRCNFYMGEPTQDISSQCYSFIRNSLTYNGCVARHRWRPSFLGDTWRIFFGESRELWKNDTDVIRLFDKEGRTVDAWSY